MDHAPDTPTALDQRIERLAALLRDAAAAGAEQIAALLPVEIGGVECAVTVWAAGDQTRYELRRVDDAERLDTDGDDALREALALIAVVETLTEAVAVETLRAVGVGLQEWRDRALSELPGLVAAEAASVDPDPNAGEARSRFELLDTELAQTQNALAQLELTVGNDPVAMASTARLDAIAAGQLALEARWSTLEDAADAFSDTIQSGHMELVAALWAALSVGRGGPLAQSTMGLVESGRQAGVAFAADVLGARFAG